MLNPDDIPKMETKLTEKGFSVAELCRRAGIAETTWGRWKRKEFMPSFRAWTDVITAYGKMVADQHQPAAE